MINFFRKSPVSTSTVQLRPSDSGVWAPYYAKWIPRKVNGMIYEIMRESIPYIDAAFDRLIDLDGVLTVTGNSAYLKSEVQDFVDNVQFGDLQKGLHAFQASWTGETLEQGFALAEYVADADRTGIARLTVADSKTILFKRKDDQLIVCQRDYAGERELNMSNILYYAVNTENTNPYGIPMMRSCESVSDTFTKIQHSLRKNWERFGDPSYSLVYKTNNKSDIESRVDKLRKSLATALSAKTSGKSADFVHGIGVNDALEIKIIGSDNQILELEIPVRVTVEQIISKTGLPPWMLGLNWSTTERQASAQLAVLRAGIIARQVPKLALLKRIVAAHLQLRGRTWNPGDWDLSFVSVNMEDIEKLARANFLDAQAQYYRDVYGSANTEKSAHAGNVHKYVKKTHKSVDVGETRPIEWPELDKIEDEYAKSIESGFDKFYREVCKLINVTPAKAVEDEPADGLTAEQIAAITADLDIFISTYNPINPNSPIAVYYAAAVAAGLLKGATLAGSSVPELTIDLVQEMTTALAKKGFELLGKNAREFSRQTMMTYLTEALTAGTPHDTVARELRKHFDGTKPMWDRLVVSEMTMAAERGKLAEYEERGIGRVEWKLAPDACSRCVAIAGTYDIDKAPVPVQDSHPHCRCTLIPKI